MLTMVIRATPARSRGVSVDPLAQPCAMTFRVSPAWPTDSVTTWPGAYGLCRQFDLLTVTTRLCGAAAAPNTTVWHLVARRVVLAAVILAAVRECERRADPGYAEHGHDQKL